MVRETWSATSSSISSVDNWLSKTRLLRKKTKGRAINIEAALRKKKKSLLMEFDLLDVLSESQQLSAADHDRMKAVKTELEEIWKKEETAFW